MINQGNKLMTEVATGRDIALNWDVLVTPGIPAVTSDLAPGTKQLMWSPISSTLISGKRDSVDSGAKRNRFKRSGFERLCQAL